MIQVSQNTFTLEMGDFRFLGPHYVDARIMDASEPTAPKKYAPVYFLRPY